jgi:hypothetical protein
MGSSGKVAMWRDGTVRRGEDWQYRSGMVGSVMLWIGSTGKGGREWGGRSGSTGLDWFASHRIGSIGSGVPDRVVQGGKGSTGLMPYGGVRRRRGG